MGQSAVAQTGQQDSTGNFQVLTTRNRQQLSDVAFANPGESKNQDLFATGFASYLHVMAVGTITTGTSAAGTWDANYWPWNLMKRLTLRSNAGFQYYDTEGWFNRIIQKYHRLGFDPGLQVNPGNGPGAYSNRGAQIAQIQFPTGAVASSTVYPILVHFLIPIVSHPDLRAGLLPLQNNATRVTLQMQLGGVTDWLGASGVLGVGGTVNVTVRTMMEFFSMTNDARAMPDLSFIHRIIQDTQAWTATGDQDYRVPVNGIILRGWEHFRNAGVPQPNFATANNPTTPSFGNQSVIYAASENPEVYDFRFGAYQHRLDYETDLTDGTFMFDFASGGGSIEMGASSRDAYNTRALTEFKWRVNTSIAPSANSTIEVVRQELQPRNMG